MIIKNIGKVSISELVMRQPGLWGSGDSVRGRKESAHSWRQGIGGGGLGGGVLSAIEGSGCAVACY